MIDNQVQTDRLYAGKICGTVQILSRNLTLVSSQTIFVSSMSMSTIEILKEITPPVKKKYCHFLEESQINLNLIKFKY